MLFTDKQNLANFFLMYDSSVKAKQTSKQKIDEIMF